MVVGIRYDEVSAGDGLDISKGWAQLTVKQTSVGDDRRVSMDNEWMEGYIISQ